MKYLILGSSFLLFFLAASTIKASGDVVINELLPDPSGPSSEPDEWIELYNNSNSEVDVSGWQVDDIAGSGSSPFTIPPNTKISPNGFYVLEKDATSIILNNTSDTVRLLNKESVEVDKFGYSSTQEDRSYARSPDGGETWIVTTPTKGSPNPKPPKSPDGKLLLSEFSPNPDQGEEWVEIYNPNKFTVGLAGWKIDDIPEGSSPHTLPENTRIAKKSYKVFYFSNKLNNTGDTLRLINPSGKVLESYKFSAVDKDVIFAKDEAGTWQQTTTATPGEENKITGSSSNDSDTRDGSTLESTGLSGSGLTNVGDILGVENPTFVSDLLPPEQAENNLIDGTKNTKNSPSTILIGIGFIFLGLAVGLPIFKNQNLPKE